MPARRRGFDRRLNVETEPVCFIYVTLWKHSLPNKEISHRWGAWEWSGAARPGAGSDGVECPGPWWFQRQDGVVVIGGMDGARGDGKGGRREEERLEAGSASKTYPYRAGLSISFHFCLLLSVSAFLSPSLSLLLCSFVGPKLTSVTSTSQHIRRQKCS